MTKFGDKTVLHVHVQVTSSFSQPLYCKIEVAVPHFEISKDESLIRLKATTI